MIHEKTKAKVLGFHKLFLSCFFALPESKQQQQQQQRNSHTLKHALVNNNKESIIESRIMKGFLNLKSISTLLTHEITNHKLQKQSYFVLITCIIPCHIFAPRKLKKISYISIAKISIYLLSHFYFLCFISTQFADFAFLKIQLQITFGKSFNVLNNIIWPML